MPDHPIDPDPRSEALSRATRIARRLRRQRDAARRETESLRAQLAAADVLLNAAMCLIEFPKSDQKEASLPNLPVRYSARSLLVAETDARTRRELVEIDRRANACRGVG